MSKKDRRMAGLFGGSDIDDWEEYERENTDQYFNKGNHKKRSLFWSPNHNNHWKKEEKK